MIRALVLDFDGLIIDSEVAVARAWEEVFAREGLAFPEDAWRSMVGTRENDGLLWTELERLTGRRFDPLAHDPERRRRGVELSQGLGPLPGVVELIGEAHGRGMRLAVASSSSRWWVGGHLERLGLAHRFEIVRTREDVQRSKPFPDVYREALAAFAVTPSEAVAFEDSAPGVEAAKAAGLTVVAVPGSYTEHMDFGAADVIVGSLEEFSLDTLIRERR